MDIYLLRQISKQIFKNKSALDTYRHLGREGVEGVYRAWLCEGKAGKYVIKLTEQSELINLQHAKGIGGIKTPRLCGSFPKLNNSNQVYIIMEFVPWNDLETIYGGDVQRYQQEFDRAVKILVKIHGAKNIVSSFNVDIPSIKKSETEEIKRKLCKIYQSYEYYKRQKREKAKVSPSEIKILQEKIDPKGLIEELYFSGELVFQHGDYKPDNILVSSAELFIIDWTSAGPGSGWYDLAYLLADIDNKDHQRATPFVKTYIKEAHRNSFFDKVTENDAHRLFEFGRIYQEVIRAYSNAQTIDKPLPHNVEQYGISIESLVKLSK